MSLSVPLSQDGEIVMSWNLALFLPRGVRAPFAAAVSGLLGAAVAAPGRLPAMLAGEIAQKLFQMTEQIHTRMPVLKPGDLEPRPGRRGGREARGARRPRFSSSTRSARSSPSTLH
ncbi:uncharacterized protein [Choristoneura fumiferana]|uniref:uncharacterized protein n=1 Tax=Choristoneura fumiferana TaxID=7141 RepID=UPI003D15D154